MTWIRVYVWILLFFSIVAHPDKSWASDLDIDQWLNRPGVRMVVVEFFATWCKPCMEAVPKWRKLHDKYRKDGLRLIVVSTQDPNGLCRSPGWNPDEVVCDDDGTVARRFQTQGKLPAAFLWGWQGHLLVQRGHVEEVEKKVEEWIRRTPRLAIDVTSIVSGSETDTESLLGMVREELRRFDKLTVVATEEERQKLRDIVKRSLEATANEALECELGKEITANSLLKVSILGRPRFRKLQFELFDAEEGCLVAGVSTRWNPEKQKVVVGEGITALLSMLKRPSVQYPWIKSDKEETKEKKKPQKVDDVSKQVSESDKNSGLEASEKKNISKEDTQKSGGHWVGLGVEASFGLDSGGEDIVSETRPGVDGKLLAGNGMRIMVGPSLKLHPNHSKHSFELVLLGGTKIGGSEDAGGAKFSFNQGPMIEGLAFYRFMFTKPTNTGYFKHLGMGMRIGGGVQYSLGGQLKFEIPAEGVVEVDDIDPSLGGIVQLDAFLGPVGLGIRYTITSWNVDVREPAENASLNASNFGINLNLNLNDLMTW